MCRGNQISACRDCLLIHSHYRAGRVVNVFVNSELRACEFAVLQNYAGHTVLHIRSCSIAKPEVSKPGFPRRREAHLLKKRRGQCFTSSQSALLYSRVTGNESALPRFKPRPFTSWCKCNLVCSVQASEELKRATRMPELQHGFGVSFALNSSTFSCFKVGLANSSSPSIFPTLICEVVHLNAPN